MQGLIEAQRRVSAEQGTYQVGLTCGRGLGEQSPQMRPGGEIPGQQDRPGTYL